ncbi:MAG: amino acid ABC transporter ATP-binding protein [Hyphomicrobiaceae bacterium]
MIGSRPIVKVTGLCKSFTGLQVLKDVSLEVAPGETIVVIGPSGSGKSTLLRCINLLEPIDRGTIEFDGEDITHLGRQAFRARRDIGMVFQSFELFAHLTALENIMLAPMRTMGVERAEAMATARALLEKVRIPEKADFYPDELSGGQQQRVAIARALAMKPKVMLYDEPTSALDPEMIKEVLDVIQDLAREGTTGVVVTHEMAFARRVADRVIFMESGQVVDDAPTLQFFQGTSSERAKRFLDQILQH